MPLESFKNDKSMVRVDHAPTISLVMHFKYLGGIVGLKNTKRDNCMPTKALNASAREFGIKAFV